jgi:protein involved in polysaccharide export with SLBB domain
MRAGVDRALLADDGNILRSQAVSQAYRIASPDVLAITIGGRANARGLKRVVGPDGRVDLGELGQPRIEGQTVLQAASTIAQVCGAPEQAVRVEVAEYKSQIVYVIGQVVGAQHAVAYIGPERVVDLLHRAGGITVGAAPDAVYVVRAHVSEAQAPEVLRVDLRGILFRHEEQTNVVILPLDQVFVGESRRCAFERGVAPWLRPIYELCCGMRRPDNKDRDTSVVAVGYQNQAILASP